MAYGPITSWQIDGETVETLRYFILGGSKITADGDCIREIKRHLLLGRKVMTSLDTYWKAETLLCQLGSSSQGYGVSSSLVWMWELNFKEIWGLKKWCFWTVALEKTLESLLTCKGIHPVHPKRNQSWIFMGRTEVEAETPILWPPDAKSWLIWRDPEAGKDWRPEEKRTTEDETVGWHHSLHALEFGKLQELVMWRWWCQGGLACCGPWGRKESDTTEWLTELK